MTARLTVTIDAWPDGGPIPEEFAFCAPADPGPVTMGKNVSPPIRWSGAPAATQSFAIICHDPDVPSKPDAVNKEGLVVPASLPRIDFFHWVLVDISPHVQELKAGADSSGITARGKTPGPTPHGVRGINNYTDWFSSDADMKGDYGGYDGPCPPWNDEILHHYIFTVYALDVPSLGLAGRFGGPEALQALEGHVLAHGTWVGTYTLNPQRRGR
jgi:Raf kinase inhibitor-like YbhB/YbcL family protein